MNRVFKLESDLRPQSVSAYERLVLEEIFLDSDDAANPGGESREAILAEARREAERKVREAHAEGARRGFEAGRMQYLEAVAESAAALQSAAEALKKAREDFFHGLEPQVVELAVTIATRLLHREIHTDRELVHRTVRKALEHLAGQESVVIRLHPADLEALRHEKIRLLEEFDGIRQITLQADESMLPGGCVAETSLVQVDGRLEAQLEEILNSLRESP